MHNVTSRVWATHNVVEPRLIYSDHVRQVYTGDNGILSAVQKGSLLIDCSTIDGEVAIEMSKEALTEGAVYIDAPVSGGIQVALELCFRYLKVLVLLLMEFWLSCWVGQVSPTNEPNRFWKRWERMSSIVVALVQDRLQRFATTCC